MSNAFGVLQDDLATLPPTMTASERLPLHLELANEYLGVDSARGGAIALKAVDIALGLGEVEAQADAITLYGLHLRDSGRSKECIRAFSEALELFRSLTATPAVEKKVGLALYYVGSGHATVGSIVIAMQYLDRAEALFRKIKNDLGYAKVLQAKSVCKQHLGRLGEAIELSGQAAQIYRRFPNCKADLAYVLFNHCNQMADQDAHADTTELLEKAVALAQEVKKPRLLAYCYGQMGVSFASLNRMSEARKYLDLALGAARSAGDNMAVGWTFLYLGRFEERAGNKQEAARHYMAAAQIGESYSAYDLGFRAHAALAVMMQLGKHVLAKKAVLHCDKLHWLKVTELQQAFLRSTESLSSGQ